MVNKQYMSRWWFQIFFIFTPVWGRFPIWLIFFRWVETTNQISNKCRLQSLELGACKKNMFLGSPFPYCADWPTQMVFAEHILGHSPDRENRRCAFCGSNLGIPFEGSMFTFVVGISFFLPRSGIFWWSYIYIYIYTYNIEINMSFLHISLCYVVFITVSHDIFPSICVCYYPAWCFFWLSLISPSSYTFV